MISLTAACLMLVLLAVLVAPARLDAASAPSASPVTAAGGATERPPAGRPIVRGPADPPRESRPPTSASQDRALFLLLLLHTQAGSRGR